MQLLRFADGSGWSLGAVTGSDGWVMSLPVALRQLRQRGRWQGLSAPFLDVISTNGRALLACWLAVRGAAELAAELDDGSARVAGNLSELRIGPFVPAPEKVLGVSYNYSAPAEGSRDGPPLPRRPPPGHRARARAQFPWRSRGHPCHAGHRTVGLPAEASRLLDR